MDTRSQPDEMQPGSLRWRQNIQAVGERTVRRGCGWSKLFTQSNYNNADFHDQLLAITGGQREPITYQQEIEATDGARYLFIGTQSRLFRLNQYSGNYVFIGGGYGGGVGVDCAGPRFQGAILGDYAIFTNGHDAPFYHVVDQYPNLDGASVNVITDLAVIGLQTARKVWVWRNVVFFANVQMDGVKMPWRIVWGDYNAPLSLDPAKQGSIAGYQDLAFGEQILAAAPYANSYLIYTNKNVYQMSVGTGGTFSFQALPGFNSQNCIRYENTLVNIGDGHAYMGKDRIYFYNQYMSEPDITEWLHYGDNPIYDNIDESNCTANVATLIDGEVYFSVKTMNSTNGCPDITLRVNKNYKYADIVDYGFTSLRIFRPQNTPSLRDFLIDQKICDAASLKTIGAGWTNEGVSVVLAPTGAFVPQCTYTHESIQTPIGISIEDLSQPNPAHDSLCALLNADGYPNMDSFCKSCDANPILIGASSDDWCLKQIGGVFYRERCVNVSAVGIQGELGYQTSAGVYSLDGYDSMIYFAPMWLQDSIASVSKVKLNYIAAQQSPVALAKLSVGVSGQVADANVGQCAIKWGALTPKPLVCMTAEISKKTSPSADLQWNFYFEGKFVHAKLEINGVGGDSLLSGVQADVSASAQKNY